MLLLACSLLVLFCSQVRPVETTETAEEIMKRIGKPLPRIQDELVRQNETDASLQDQIDAISTENTAREGEITALNERVTSLNGEKVALHDQVTALSEEGTARESQLDALVQENDLVKGILGKVSSCLSPPEVAGTSKEVTVGADGQVSAKYSCKTGFFHIRGDEPAASDCFDGYWYPVNIVCSDYTDCYHDPGWNYGGQVWVTFSGRTCQKWVDQYPHSHHFKQDSQFVGLAGTGTETVANSANYCRNPDGEPGPWCYTTDSSKRWELCDVPDC